MASIGKDPNGRKRILFVAEDSSRKTIRLGKASMKQANAFKVRLEALVSRRFAGSIDDETARWIAELPDDAHAKLAAVGLVEPRKSTLLAPFLEGYLQGRTDVKPATLVNLGHTQRNMIEFFGADKPLRDITEGDATDWCVFLKEQGLSEATIRKRCGNAKLFFRAATRHKLVSSNPFLGLKSFVKGNKDRQFFVTREMVEQVLEACPDVQWRTQIGLGRWGGLRIPSESARLRWEDVDWAKGTMLVHSPKTEHHPNGKTRMVPLFPELRAILMEAFEAAEEGAEFVIVRRDTSANLRTHLNRIIKRAGLVPWPKPFQNLRSTRETELLDSWPEHVVCAWIGNSKAVAMEHYNQVTDEHFRKAAQNPAQYPAVEGSNEQEADLEDNQEGVILPCVTRKYLSKQNLKLGRAGFEPA